MYVHVFNPFKAETAPIRHLVKSGSDLVGAVIVRFVHFLRRLLILVFNQSSDTMFCRRQAGYIGAKKVKVVVLTIKCWFALGLNVVSLE